MTKIVINRCHGGFGLSDQARDRYCELAGITRQGNEYFFDYDIDRDSPHLVQTVEELKEQADGRFAQLKVVEIPDDVEWTIDEYDGLEWVAEAHRTWS